MNMLFIITLEFIAGLLITLLFIGKKVIKNIRKPKNKVHFYVARDKDGSLWVYIGKPIRGESIFEGKMNIYFTKYNFHILGLNENDYDNLKWEDEPVEVFLNMED